MKQLVILLILSLILLLYNPAHSNAQSLNYWHTDCSVIGVVSGSETAYAQNLNFALTEITTAASQGLLEGVAWYGNNAFEFAEALFYCRGEGSGVTTADCQACVVDARVQLLSMCSTSADATIYYRECTVHVANRDMRGMLQTQPWFFMWNLQTLPLDPTVDFSETALNLQNSVIDTASRDTIHGFSYGTVQITSDAGLYFMAQCSRDIIQYAGPAVCNTCLQTSLQTLNSNFQLALKDSQLYGMLMPSCQILIAYFPIDGSVSADAPPPPIPTFVQPASINSTADAPLPSSTAPLPSTPPVDPPLTAPPVVMAPPPGTDAPNSAPAEDSPAASPADAPDSAPAEDSPAASPADAPVMAMAPEADSPDVAPVDESPIGAPIA